MAKRWLCWALAAWIALLPLGVSQGQEEPAEAILTEELTADEPIDEAVCEQIRATYAVARKATRSGTFAGYCGAYVARQLLLLGINSSYKSCSGKLTYDAYCRETYTSGGYAVTAFSGKEYTLAEALHAIEEEDPEATNILVGFERSTSKAGQKFGHTLFIYCMQDGMVYYSENHDQQMSGVRYREGEPIVCSIETFAASYGRCKLDGVIHFEKTLASTIHGLVPYLSWNEP